MRHVGHGFTGARLTDVLHSRDQVAHLAGAEFGDLLRIGSAGTDLEGLVLGTGLHEEQLVPLAHATVHHAHARHHAAELVVLTVEDQRLQRRVRIALGGGNAGADGVEQLRHALTGLGGDAQDVLGGDAEHLLDLHREAVRIGGGEVDLVERRDDLEVVLQREVTVGEGLGLDALRGVDHQHHAFAGGERTTDFVTEVHVARGVDEVQRVALPLHPHVLGLDGDAAFALEVHRVEVLLAHLAGIHRLGELEDAIAERRLPVVDVRNDREVADAGLFHEGVAAARKTGAKLRQILLVVSVVTRVMLPTCW